MCFENGLAANVQNSHVVQFKNIPELQNKLFILGGEDKYGNILDIV